MRIDGSDVRILTDNSTEEGAPSWVPHRRPATEARAEDALIHYEYHCGGRCGAGELAWLRRDQAGHWRVQKLRNFWMS